jgi:DNA-binding beta-propeller fold protein YncE
VRSGVSPRVLTAVLVGILVVAAVAAAIWLRPALAPSLTSPAAAVSAEATPTLAGRFPAEGRPRLRNPLGVAVSGQRVYVAESDAGVVRVFDLDGSDVASLAVPVVPGAAAAYPADVAPLSQGRIAVLDTAGGRVLVLNTANGRVLSVVGSADASASLGKPTAVAAAGDELYVADAADRTVKVYGRDGRLERVLGASLRPTLTFPAGMALAGGRLWVSDSNAGRVLAIDPSSGAQVTVLPVPFSLPRGVAAGPAGSVLVADTFARTVSSFDASGTRGFVIGAGTDLRSPRGVAYSAGAGSAYVADAASGVVLIYRFRPNR